VKTPFKGIDEHVLVLFAKEFILTKKWWFP
jgi:hypothetical protein